jgi:hypothetical protein
MACQYPLPALTTVADGMKKKPATSGRNIRGGPLSAIVDSGARPE